MAKINFNAMKRPEPETETRTFTDDLQPGAELVVTFLSRADFPEGLDIQALSEEWIARFAAPSSLPLAAADGSAIKVSPKLCQVIATIQVLSQGDLEGRYTFEEWVIASACMPTAFEGVVTFAEEIMTRARIRRPLEKPEIPND